MNTNHRKLLQVSGKYNVSEINKSLSPTPAATAAIAAGPSFQPINGTAAAAKRPYSSSTQFDSSMALTILVVFTALFFMGFFSVYIRRLAADPDSDGDSTPPSPPRPRPTPTPNRRKGGLEPSAMGSLPLVAYGKASKRRMTDDCTICLSEFQERETVKLIPYCGHVFHAMCIDTWLASHVTCPLCRSDRLFGCDAAQV